ncbi:MAG: hypothetical protein JSS02_33815 [Planctomycetes bacterium]|nr:hypothetical protein [Planctomycetota bacterium]
MHRKDNLLGTLVIAALIAAGVGLARNPLSLAPDGSLHFRLASEPVTPIANVAVRQISWSADSRRFLAVETGDIGVGGPLVIHDRDSGPQRLTIGSSGEPIVLAELIPDGQHLLVATREGQLWWSHLQHAERQLLLQLPEMVDFSALAVSRDSRQIAVASSDGSLYLITPPVDNEAGTRTPLISGPAVRTTRLAFSPDGQALVTAAYDGSIRQWDLKSGRIRQTWTGHSQPATAVAVLPDGRIISASQDDTIRLWEIDSEREVWRLESELLGVSTLAVSSDGKSAAWGGHRRKIVVWDLTSWQRRHEISISASMVWDLQFSPDGHSLAVAGNDGTLELIDAHTGAKATES